MTTYNNSASEKVKLSETINKAETRGLSDKTKLSDSIKKDFSRTVTADKTKLSESFKKALGKTVGADKIKLADSFSKTYLSGRPAYEGVLLGDDTDAQPTYGTGTVRMIYGGYEFEPTPLITYARELIRDGKENKLFQRVTLGCSSAAVLISGVKSFGRLDVEEFKLLEQALSNDHQRLTITHESGYFVRDVFPRIEGFTTEEDVWVNKIRYNFNFVYDEAIDPAAKIESFSDNWDWNETEDGRVEVSHNISAKGLHTNTYKTNNSLTNAQAFVTPRLGRANIPATFPVQLGAIFGDKNHVSYIRRLYSESVDKNEGSYSVTESFILASGADLTFIETRRYELGEDENGLTNLTVNGTILGEGNRPATRATNALEAWNELQPTLYDLAATVYEELDGSRILNSNILSRSVTRNDNAGTIDYSVSFGDKVNDVNAENIIDSNFTITRRDPIAQHASIPIPGRALGPIIQDLGTINEGTYSISGRIVGQTLEDAISYANHLINTYSGEAIGSFSRITDKSYDKDILSGTVNFSLTWTFIGSEASPLLS